MQFGARDGLARVAVRDGAGDCGVLVPDRIEQLARMAVQTNR